MSVTNAEISFTEPAGFRPVAGARLRDFPYTTVPDAPGLRRAAVVLCVRPGEDGALGVVVIKRAYQGRNAGQWGLPGGRLDEAETPVQGALRELEEELGLVVDPADVLGRLDDFPAASGFSITPIVVMPPAAAPLHPSPDEVHSVHFVRLDRLAADDTPRWVTQHEARRQAELRGLSTGAASPSGEARLLQMRLAPDMVIHAPTGAMLWQFREVVLLGHSGPAVRVAGFLQPDWTHR